MAGRWGGMGEAGDTAGFCLALVRSATAGPRVVGEALAARLRVTDSVAVQTDVVVVGLAGDRAGALRALARVRACDPALELTAELVTDGHDDFAVLRHALGEPPAARPPVPSSTDHGRAATAVIVDDNDDVRTMLGQLISRAGWTAVTAEMVGVDSIGAVVETCQSSGADVLVTDYHLGGGITGVDLSLACRRAGLGFPIVLFTASGWMTTAEDAERVGATLIISKGQVDELLGSLDRLADRLRLAHRRGP